MERGLGPAGISADLLATLNGIGRSDVDAFALESQKRAVEAIETHKFDKSVVPVKDDNGLTILARDEYPRPDTSLEKLGELKPSFEQMGRQFGLDYLTRDKYPQVERIDHIHTAGNSSGIVDGAAAGAGGEQGQGRVPRAAPARQDPIGRPVRH